MSDSRRAMITKAILEVALVGIGVFLGMAADQWRTEQRQHARAIETLRRFTVELENNRAAVANVKDYHATTRAEIIKYLDPKQRSTANVRIKGIQSVNFEHTAWDLAITTQSLADIEPIIAFELTSLYGLQQSYAGLTNGLTQAMYFRPPGADFDGFLQSVKVYYDDLVFYEPELLTRYDRVLPMIESALRD